MKKLLDKKFSFGEFEIDYIVLNDKPDFDFFEVKQVHGNEVVAPQKELVEADGIFSLYENFPSQPLAIKTADCLPVVMIGKKGVAIVHAGWRGVHQEILISPQLQDLEIHSLFIGPAIQADSYEVGPEFKEHFKDFPGCLEEKKGRLTLNLPQAAEIQMRKHFPQALIQASPIDTFTTPGHNSYRKDKTARRNYNLLYVKFSKS
ncbi:MAG: polyphenol oxidase family protein [Halobacteriovoraceae bacterium]|nr:polyphenol oxidase family protein [Halobacteriovoraceae bacterium]